MCTLARCNHQGHICAIGTVWGGIAQYPAISVKHRYNSLLGYSYTLWCNRGCHNLSGPVACDTARLSQRYPPIARYGVLLSQHGQLGAVPPPPFLSVSPPWRECEVEVRYPPPLRRGISAILARYPMKTRQMGAIPPLCDTISKRYCAIWGGISHWAAKVTMLGVAMLSH